MNGDDALGARGRGFESRHPDQFPQLTSGVEREILSLARLVAGSAAKWRSAYSAAIGNRRGLRGRSAMTGLGEESAAPPALVAAWFALGVLPSERLPWWAAEWLAEGRDGEALRELAGLDDSDPRAINDLVPAVLAEMNVSVPSTDVNAAPVDFSHIARLQFSGRAGERWVAQKVEEIVQLTLYDRDVKALPLGQLHGMEEAWEQGWEPVDKLKEFVRRKCAEQLGYE